MMKKLMNIVVSIVCGILLTTVSFAKSEKKIEIPQALYSAIVQHFQFYMQYREGLITNARYQEKLNSTDKSDKKEAQHFEYQYANYRNYYRNYYRGLLLSDLYIASTYAGPKTKKIIQQFEAWDQKNLTDTIHNAKLPTLSDYAQWRDRVLSSFTFSQNDSDTAVVNPAKLYKSTIKNFELMIAYAELNRRGKVWIKTHTAKDRFTQEKDHAVLMTRLNQVLPEAFLYEGKLYGDLMLVQYTYHCKDLNKSIANFMQWDSANTDYNAAQYRQWENTIINKLKICLFS